MIATPFFKDNKFGCVLSGCNPADLTAEEFEQVNELLHKVRHAIPHSVVAHSAQHSVIVFKDVDLSPENQDKLTRVSCRHSFVRS